MLAMSSEDEEVRLQGLKSLVNGAPEQILVPIFQAFGDTSWRVRKEAIEMFLTLPVSRELIGEIVELLHAEENVGLRNAAVEILVRMGRNAVPMLLERIGCPDHDVRKFIVDILGEIDDPQAVPALINALQDNDNNVVAAAAENLGKLKASEAVPALLDAMRNPDVLLRFTILEALGQIDQPIPLARLEKFNDEKLLRKALIDCLGKVGDPSAVPEIIAGLSEPMRNVRSSALLALVNIAERYPQPVRSALSTHDLPGTVDAVAAFLKSGQPDQVRTAALLVLGWLGADSMVNELLELLDEEVMQQPVVYTLTEIGKVKPFALVGAWPRIPDSRRPYLAYVLGEAGCMEALGLLRESLADKDPQLRRMVVHALGKLACQDVIPDLVGALCDGDETVQGTASQALAELGARFPDEVFQALKATLDGRDLRQRRYAVDALCNVNHPDVPKYLGMAMKDADPNVRRAAVKGFEGRTDDEHLANILLALTDEDSEVRRTAVEILAVSGSQEALDGLQLALNDEDIWVRAMAVRAFGRLGREAVAPQVEAVVKDRVGLVSIAALETLSEILGEKACPKCVEALDHPDEEVVSAALNILSGCTRMDWLSGHAEDLINHPFWAVRTHFVRLAAALLGEKAKPVLERRLTVETEDLVRQQIAEALETMAGL